MNGCARIAVVSLLLCGVTACGKVQAHTPVPDPALVTPAPPPRVIVPATITIPEPEPPVSPARPAQTPAKPPERPTPPTTPPVTSSTQPPATETTPPPVLQTASSIGDLEAKTRLLLAKANADLGRIDPRTLGPDARAQYDTARGFIRRADDALRDKNVVYAKELADKAAALAGLIVKH